MAKEQRLREYEYAVEVAGQWDGTVRARNAAEAREKAESDVRIEGLVPVGKINLQRG